MQAKYLSLSLIVAMLVLSGCILQTLKQETGLSTDVNGLISGNISIVPVNTTPLVSGDAENLIISLDDFSSESFSVAQFQGQYSKQTSLVQQFKTFFKPVGYPIMPLGPEEFVLTQTLTVISSNTGQEEASQLFDAELAQEKEENTVSTVSRNFAGEKSIMMITQAEGTTIIKAFVAYSNTLNELSIFTMEMTEETAIEKLEEYSQKAVERLKQ